MLHIHPNARTTPATRAEIARSTEPSGTIAKRYGISMQNSVQNWLWRTLGAIRRPLHGRGASMWHFVAPASSLGPAYPAVEPHEVTG
jgi:hypothetical protein